jgi:cellulose synthase operon protein C
MTPNKPIARRNAAVRSTVLAAALVACMGLGLAANPQVSRLYEDALLRFEKNDATGAIVQLKNALAIDNKNLAVQALLGRALLANKEVVAAEVALDEALRLGVNRTEIVVPLAQALLGQGKPQPVLDAQRFDTHHLPPAVKVPLLLLKATAASETGDPRLAMRLIDEARAMDANSPDAWLAEVPIRLRAAQFQEATASADRALKLAPESAQALYIRGTVAHLQNDAKGSLGFYDRALKVNPRHTEALVARAGVLIDLGRHADAAGDVTELGKSSAGDPRGAYLRALLAEIDKRPAEAKVALTEVTDLLDPVPLPFIRYRPQLLILGGLAHYGLNQHEKAKPYLEAALRSQPNTPVAKVLAQLRPRHRGARQLPQGPPQRRSSHAAAGVGAHGARPVRTCQQPVAGGGEDARRARRTRHAGYEHVQRRQVSQRRQRA